MHVHCFQARAGRSLTGTEIGDFSKSGFEHHYIQIHDRESTLFNSFCFNSFYFSNLFTSFQIFSNLCNSCQLGTGIQKCPLQPFAALCSPLQLFAALCSICSYLQPFAALRILKNLGNQKIGPILKEK